MTTETSLRERLAETLTSKFQVDAASVVGAATFTDLGLDSLAMVELIDLLATDLGLQLEDDELHPAMTVDEAVAALHQGAA